jgi:hypothetical protein
MAKVKRQFGEAVDTAGAVARAMERAYQLGFEEVSKGSAASPPEVVVGIGVAVGHDKSNRRFAGDAGGLWHQNVEPVL